VNDAQTGKMLALLNQSMH